MKRRRALAALAGVAAGTLAAKPGGGRAQTAPARRPARIGFLAGRDGPSFEGFRRELPLLGLIDGRDVVIEFRSAEGRPERLPELVAELLALDVAVLVASTTTAAGAARRATRTTPIVFAMLADPVAIGFVDGLARPGGNATGIGATHETASKRLQLLHQLAPAATRVALLVSPGLSMTRAEIAQSETAARQLGLRLLVFRADEAAEIDAMLAALAASDAEAVAVPPNLLFTNQPQMGRIVRAITAARLPAVYVESDWIAAGGLMTYAPSLLEFGRHMARYVARILRGVKPADLPVETPTRYELVINLAAARAIGLEVPPIIFAQADEVIE